MNTTELLSVFREEMNDQAKPYLWNAPLFFSYLDEAQSQFCRLTEGIEDASSLLTQLTLAAGTSWLPISPKVLKVRAATLDTTGAPIPVYSAEEAPRRGIRFDARTGPLRALVFGMEKSKLRAWPTAHADTPLSLQIFRLPLEALTDDDQPLEIDEQHHLPLLHWVKFRAYSKDDVETYDPRKAEQNEQRFYAYCANAKREQGRARHSAGTVAYGGY